LERSKSVLQLLYLALDQISLRVVPSLHLLTAARSQVEFGIGAEIFVLMFSWRI
jgi:hypothetical protein